MGAYLGYGFIVTHIKWEGFSDMMNITIKSLSGATLYDGPRSGLKGADLWGADLRFANLRCADLQGANLRHANLRHADLQGANLQGADLQDAILRDADLWGADLRGADLRGANLQGADLRHANLRSAILRDADLCWVEVPVTDPRPYRWLAIAQKGVWMIHAGCRCFTLSEARAYWLSEDYDGPEEVRNTVEAALDWVEAQPTDK